MHTGGQGGRYSHDQAKVNIFCIFPPGWVLDCLNCTVCILCPRSASCSGAVSHRLINHPPKVKTNNTQKVAITAITRSRDKWKTYSDVLVDASARRMIQMVTKKDRLSNNAPDAHWNLQFYIMGSLMRHHVVGKGGVDCPPVTGNI